MRIVYKPTTEIIGRLSEGTIQRVRFNDASIWGVPLLHVTPLSLRVRMAIPIAIEVYGLFAKKLPAKVFLMELARNQKKKIKIQGVGLDAIYVSIDAGSSVLMAQFLSDAHEVGLIGDYTTSAEVVRALFLFYGTHGHLSELKNKRLTIA